MWQEGTDAMAPFLPVFFSIAYTMAAGTWAGSMAKAHG